LKANFNSKYYSQTRSIARSEIYIKLKDTLKLVSLRLIVDYYNLAEQQKLRSQMLTVSPFSNSSDVSYSSFLLTFKWYILQEVHRVNAIKYYL